MTTNGSNKNKWGPMFWNTFHTFALYYPEQASHVTQLHAKAFILSIPHIIPCDSCREHAHEFIMSYKHDLDRICMYKKTLFAFFVDFHNFANNRLGKRQWTYDEAHAYYKTITS